MKTFSKIFDHLSVYEKKCIAEEVRKNVDNKIIYTVKWKGPQVNLVSGYLYIYIYIYIYTQMCVYEFVPNI